MSQILYIGKDKIATIDRTWANAGKPDSFAMMGGAKVLVEKGERPKPTVYQKGKEFYYQDMTPVTQSSDIDWLPEPHLTFALEFVSKQTNKPLKVISAKKALEVIEKVIKKGRGRPRKTLHIEDESSLVEAGVPPGKL